MKSNKIKINFKHKIFKTSLIIINNKMIINNKGFYNFKVKSFKFNKKIYFKNKKILI